MTTPLEHLSRNGRLDRFFIDGEWREPRGTAKGVVVNPATEEVVTRFPLGNGEDVDAAVSAARRAFATWSRTKPEYRAGLLDRLQALLEARSELLAQCLTLEMGAAIGYARTAQVPLRDRPCAGRSRCPDSLPLRRAARPHRRHPRTDRCLRADHAVELAALPDHRQGRAGARRRLHGRAEAERAFSFERPAVRRGDRGSRLPGRCLQPRQW